MKANTIAIVIRWFGWITIFVGPIVSAVALNDMHAEDFIIVGILANVISGVMLLGFSEIINLLQLNVYKTEKLIKALSSEKEETDKMKSGELETAQIIS